MDLVAELLLVLTPPQVTIRSAAGEDVEVLKALVERATAAAVLH